MWNKYFICIRKPLIITMILAITAISIPFQTYAVFGAGDTVVVVGDVSPTGIKNAINHQMDNLKNFTLDKVATMIAKQILHQLTISVVNWINTGFEGSPAFLTNPEAFFLDVADQVTGAFLAQNGPLSALCSPFSIDLRLNLALSQTSLLNQRYTCTLGKIIEAQKNGPEIIVNGQVVRSSSGTMEGFLGGDFSQGGWPAFIALTTEPQNNPYGASMYAQGDLYARIGAEQNKIHADLQLGSGFMSWQSCKDLPGGTVDYADPYSEEQIYELDSMAEYDPSIKIKENKNGTRTYRSCETQTPGSVIANTLQTNLDVPVVELELANDINAVVNALVTQLMTQMLQSGLHALSGGGNNGTDYTKQVIQDLRTTRSEGTINQLQTAVSPAIDQVNTYKSMYEQAFTLIDDTRSKYLEARSCFGRKLESGSTSYFPTGGSISEKVSSITARLEKEIDPLWNEMSLQKKNAAADLDKLRDISYSLTGTGSPEQVQAQMDKYTEFVRSGGMYMDDKIVSAQASLSNVQTLTQRFNPEVNGYLNQCAYTQ